MQARLLTIPASMYCEKARWALRLCRVPHIEAGSLPLIHYRRTRPVGGRSVPVVLTAAGAALRDSADVMRWCHLGAPPEWTEADMDREAEEAGTSALYPKGRTPEIVAMERKFDEKLGPHVRRWAYWQIFRPEMPPELAAAVLSAGPVAQFETMLARPLVPILRPLLLSSLNITPHKAADSWSRVEGLFAEVGGILADGRPYLTGDVPCGADLTFAALASLAVLPEEFWLRQQGFLQPDKLHPQAQEAMESLRSTPAGTLIARCYRDNYCMDNWME